MNGRVMNLILVRPWDNATEMNIIDNFQLFDYSMFYGEGSIIELVLPEFVFNTTTFLTECADKVNINSNSLIILIVI